jgi:hypothetical protein
VRYLRGNQPKLQYHYISLRQSGKVSEYLQYYPEHSAIFNDFRNNIHAYTNDLLNNYIKCYMKKEKKLTQFPEKFRTHMYTLHHEVYKKMLVPNHGYVNKTVVIQYFNSLHPSKQMFALNYDHHKKKENVTENSSAPATTSGAGETDADISVVESTVDTLVSNVVDSSIPVA